MKIGVSVEVRCPLGSVGFQSNIDVNAENVRFVNTKLEKGQSVSIRVGCRVRDLRVLAAQSALECSARIGETVTTIEGQNTGDFGLLYCVRGAEEFGSAPFELGLDDVIESIQFTNLSDRPNTIRVLIGESFDDGGPVIVDEEPSPILAIGQSEQELTASELLASGN